MSILAADLRGVADEVVAVVASVGDFVLVEVVVADEVAVSDVAGVATAGFCRKRGLKFGGERVLRCKLVKSAQKSRHYEKLFNGVLNVHIVLAKTIWSKSKFFHN